MERKIICFAGLDGSGKTTQAKLAADWMNQHSSACEFVRFHTEPIKAEASEIVRKSTQFLIENRLALSMSELEFIKEGFHIQMKLKNTIVPALAEGKNIILDRYVETFDAYQVVTGKKKNWLRVINEYLPEPDLHFFIDVPPEVCFNRIKQRGTRISDHETIDFLTRARNYYLEQRERYSFVIIDGNNTVEQVAGQVRQHIADLSCRG